ncbi:hypothetical protein SISSUDRAFT_1047436 [Sistotremastrum suecicum HHB10207 ss-3]|uniref:Uncharacterized protein n=1 Tax=Sistotremastrum suecicum HHB10207 ss-3 TaxID=1314776 RepID=A0A166D6Z1_9AGAM|nr:hypothetical protein SISSUDRAFT_1047436 [Sistotremastrum suecicum HHB10207 ss-3]
MVEARITGPSKLSRVCRNCRETANRLKLTLVRLPACSLSLFIVAIPRPSASAVKTTRPRSDQIRNRISFYCARLAEDRPA